jgi:hypothetical protein
MNLRVMDGVFDPQLVRAAAAAWPEDSPAWHVYDSPLERKRALNVWAEMGEPCRALLRELLAFPAWEPLGLDRLQPDTTLWGAGLHELPDGGHLDVHLDSDRHRLCGYERRANAILFLNEWWPAARGGTLEFWNTGLSWCEASIVPRFNRLVLFEVTDTSYHGNPNPVRSEEPRRTLAAYWWGLPRGEGKRSRASFVGINGEADPNKEAMRRERAQ